MLGRENLGVRRELCVPTIGWLWYRHGVDAMTVTVGLKPWRDEIWPECGCS